MHYSTYANPTKNSTCDQINKFMSTENDGSDDDDKTVVHSNCTKYGSNRVICQELQNPTAHRIFDSVTAGSFLILNAPMINKYPTPNPQCIILPDGKHTCLLGKPQFLVTTRTALIVTDLAHSSLISIKQFYDAG